MPDQGLNHLRVFLLGGNGAPAYAPRGLLAFKGLTVEQLARASGLTRTTIYNYISAEDRPTAPSLHRICEALGVPFKNALEYCDPAPVGRPRLDSSRSHNGREFQTVTATEGPILNAGDTNLAVFERNSEAQKARRKRTKVMRISQTRTEDFTLDHTSSGAFVARKGNTVPAEPGRGGAFARTLGFLMESHDPPLDIKSLSDSLGISYEHVRKLVRGVCLPSDLMTRELERFFQTDRAELTGVVRQDKFNREFGDELAEFVEGWSVLTDAEKASLSAQLRDFLSRHSNWKSRVISA